MYKTLSFLNFQFLVHNMLRCANLKCFRQKSKNLTIAKVTRYTYSITLVHIHVHIIPVTKHNSSSLTFPLCCRIPFHSGLSTLSKDSIPQGVAASASAAKARAVMVRTFCCSSTSPRGERTKYIVQYSSLVYAATKLYKLNCMQKIFQLIFCRVMKLYKSEFILQNRGGEYKIFSTIQFLKSQQQLNCMQILTTRLSFFFPEQCNRVQIKLFENIQKLCFIFHISS